MAHINGHHSAINVHAKRFFKELQDLRNKACQEGIIANQVFNLRDIKNHLVGGDRYIPASSKTTMAGFVNNTISQITVTINRLVYEAISNLVSDVTADILRF